MLYNILQHLDLEAEIDMRYRLVYGTRAHYIDLCTKISMPSNKAQLTELTVDSPLLEISLRDIPAALEQKLPLTLPLVLQPPGNPHQLIPMHIIQHNDISACIDRFVCFCFGPYFDVNE